MKSHFLSALLLTALCCLPSAPPARAQTFDYRPATVAVYNSADPESKALAEYYAAKRGIPAQNLLGLKTSGEETISRDEFEKTIEAPLRAAFVERGWWKTGKVAPQGNIAVQTTIRVLALMRGLPLRIAEQAPAAGAAAPGPGQQNASSVDSELAISGLLEKTIAGPLVNPYYNRPEPFYALPITPMFLVGRIDGPDKATARRLIDDALATEATGLYGKAYIDLAIKNEPGYKDGESWLLAAASALEMKGVPTMVDSLPSTLPVNFPMTDAAYYLGWYTQSADGPFLNPGFRFRRGAVACHIHSFSATTLRSTKDYWCGPLLAKGACAVLGNTWEPYLDLTVHLDTFTTSLLAGRNLAEAAWGASKTVSWMGVVLGDPLYRPFPAAPAEVDKTTDADYKALRLALARWGKAGPNNDELMKNLKLAGTTLKSGPIFEFMALHSQAGTDTPELEANGWFKLALANYPKTPDKIRVLLEQADARRREGSLKPAVKILNKIIEDYPTAPETEAARAWRQLLQPAP
ncbi:MAG: hypothetical protein JWL81_1010 [Verrucomicrobiales bacterium]|nr:hypothetical protein [Verrucomicrobiales bacterium]